MAILQGHLNGTGLRVGIVLARFNQFIGDRLLEGALDTLSRSGVAPADIDVARVPGAFEIPLAAQAMARSGRYDAILCLGAVIRGATAHFEFLAGQCASGVARVGLDAGLPVLFGVLTTDTIEQAIERAGTKAGNKGAECAVAAIEMADLMRQLRPSQP